MPTIAGEVWTEHVTVLLEHVVEQAVFEHERGDLTRRLLIGVSSAESVPRRAAVISPLLAERQAR